ncbi:InlB B-repeat-containing protein [Mogibacterium neglectum]|uniref:InlB B-repeat-containing protein n=1 Tax=Mogibacterium neglectum TaxID=114528 RepID=UPI00272BD0E5|nr:InlB B-repeat-containing protein [Mogibacterium neglectum]WLD76284.1 InlB B-repeat-containing protein [Mogibacterium neglectum]
MGCIYNPKKVSAVLATILAVMLLCSLAFQRASAYTEKDTDLLYSTEKVVLKGMPVKDKGTKKLITDPIKFKYWDSTLQEYQGEVTSKDGILPDVELYKGHHYIFYSEDSNYITYNPNGKGVNIYLVLNETGSKAVNDRYYRGKGSETIDEFLMTKRSTPEADPENARRVKVSLPVFYEKDDSDSFDFGNTKIRFTSDTDVVEVPIKFGFVNAKLYEDMNYTVTVVSDDYTLDPFPLTVKDHSEDGRDKVAYMHFSCSPVSYIFLKDKSDAHNKDTTITSLSGKTSITGTNFMHGNYILRDRVLNMDIPKLQGKDYQVLDIDTINLYRNELSKIAAGNFKVTTAVPAGKTVNKVYYIDNKKELHEVPSKQTGDKVTFEMNSVGVYNNVILYKQQNAPKFDVSINGYAKWKDAYTLEAALDTDDFTIPADGASHVYLMTMDGSERIFLSNEDKLVKDGNKLIVKLKNKSYRDYRKFTELGLSVGSIESSDGGAMKSATAAHLISSVKFKLKSISYEEPTVKESNAGKIVANITGENLYFGEKPGENYDNFSIIPETEIDDRFVGSINGQLKFDVEVIDNEHAKITVSNIPENKTGKDQKWKVRVKRGWAVTLTPEIGTDDFVTIKARGEETPAKHSVKVNVGEGGTAQTDVTEAKAGDKVTVKVAPDAKHKLGKDVVSVKDASNNKIEVTTEDSKTYSFTMPDADVNVSVKFEKEKPKFDVAINGYANWKDSYTIEAALDSNSFTIPSGGASHVYLMTMDGSEKVYLSNDDQLVKDGNKLIVKLKNKSYHDYKKFTELGLSVGAIEGTDGGAMKSDASAHLLGGVKFSLQSISYDEPRVKEYNANKIVAHITGKNLYFGETQYTNYSIMPEVAIDGKFNGPINGQLKFDVNVIDDEHADITISNIPENTTGKDQKWTVRINRGWATQLTPETGADDYVTIKTKAGAVPVNEYTVTFNSNGGTHVVNQVVKEGQKAKRPLEPTREDYVFAGWYTDNACTESFNFDNPIKGNTTVYAKWTPKAVEPTKHTVVFDSNGGSEVTSQTVNDGEKATAPAVPTKAGHRFDKWMNGTTAYDFNTPVKGNLKLTASWVANTYTVAFDTDGGSVVANQSVKFGEKATKPTNPAKSGYTFVGWYTDRSYATEFDYTKAIMANTTVYAKWKADVVTPSTPVAEYKFTIGKDAAWNGGDLKFKIENAEVDKNAAGDKVIDRFQGIEVDGQTVDPSNYDAKAGSVVLTLKESYIRSLTSGRHTIKAKFRGGETASTSFTVTKASANNNINQSASANKTSVAKKNLAKKNVVKTDDNTNMFADILALILATSALVGIATYRRKRA